MKTLYAVTFEFDEKAPAVRGQVAGSSATTVAKRALQDAVKQAPHQVWQSLSLLLEKTNS